MAADLRRCRDDWLSLADIPQFDLGEQDRTRQLIIPERLYGREAESKKLRGAFDRVSLHGESRLLLVSGYSGVGKSALINELQKAVVKTRGIFASGKFEQYKQDLSYATVAIILRQIVTEILNRNESERLRWRDAILSAWGTNGQLILDLAPELKQLVGPQPVPPPRFARQRSRTSLARHFGGVPGGFVQCGSSAGVVL